MAKTSSQKKIVRRVKAGGASLSSPVDSVPTKKATITSDKAISSKTKSVADKADVSPKSRHLAKRSNGDATKNTTKKTSPTSKRATTPWVLRPLCAIGRYFRDSWRELKKVQWPNRRSTWMMTLAVLVFSVFIGLFVLVCDWASQWLIQEVIL